MEFLLEHQARMALARELIARAKKCISSATAINATMRQLIKERQALMQQSGLSRPYSGEDS